MPYRTLIHLLRALCPTPASWLLGCCFPFSVGPIPSPTHCPQMSYFRLPQEDLYKHSLPGPCRLLKQSGPGKLSHKVAK